ncbi:MAG: 3-hydroxyacyl-ACP dehydratase FabZ [Bacilli bacterium]|nr:3-hydroxyacyl-ACP dehydratase FabZ [Bacilli bacterium]MDD4077792.1 3-hydroxyacyl-ACP dehydratase FabZ [Bacilli bacterium]MDD4388534.1 3-hydroxyacyl-ACP dehydratase FabZ [Bacilli bacterium]
MVLNSNQIQSILPHRYPFLMVDRIDELEVGKRAVGVKCVSVDEPYFIGHFPEEHVMPGVLIIEALAQVGAVALLVAEANKGKTAYFAGIRSAKFRRKVIPGDTLILESELIKLRGVFGISKGIAKVGDEIVCVCEIIFTLA